MNKKNNFLLVIISMLVLIGISNPVFAIGDASINVDVTLLNQIPTNAKAGDLVDITLKVENLGSNTINNLKIKALPSYPLEIYGKEEKTIASLSPYQQGKYAYFVDFTFKVSPDAINSQGNFKLSLEYLNKDISIITQDYEINILTKDPVIDLINISSSKDKLMPNEETTLSLMFENTYNQDLHDVTITFNLEQLPFRTINSPNQIYLDSIKANSKIEVTKLIGVSSEALSKIYSIPITINYKNQDLTSEYLKTYNFGIQVYNKEPIIDLVNVAISEDRLKPGKDYEVELNIRNNFNSDLYDIVVTLGSQTSPFQIINSANQIYVDSLKGGSQISVSRKIIISPEAEAKVHSIPVTIKYKNTDLSKEYQKVYDFGMIVDVNNLIETHLLKNEVKSTNSSGTVTLNIINKENSKIKFVEAEILESNDDSYHLIDQTRKKYIGNLDSDDYDSVDFNIKVDKKHPTLRLKVTAQDAYNNNIEKIFEIPLEIYSEKEAIDRGIIPNPTADGFASMAGPIIILLILSIFWLFMIINAISQEYDVPSKKYLWIATVVLTHALGAILFYFFGKRK